MTMVEPVPPFIGRMHHPGYEMPLWLRGLEEAKPSSEHLRLVNLTNGACLVPSEGGGKRAAAPAVLFLGPEDHAHGLERGRGIVLCFHPSVINAALSIASLREQHGMTGTVSQDAYLLRAFFGPTAKRILPLDARADVLVRSALANIVREGTMQRDGNWPCRVRAYLIELLFTLRLTIEQLAPAPTDGLFDRALPIVRDKLAEKFSVPDLALWCATNRSSLNAAFRAQTGRSVHAYITQMRMELAAALLRDTALPVSEILVRVGYENSSHFSRQFRAVVGATPGAYRRKSGGLGARSRRPRGEKVSDPEA